METDFQAIIDRLDDIHDNSNLTKEIIWLERANVKTAWLYKFDGTKEEAIDMCNTALLQNYVVLSMSRTFRNNVVSFLNIYILHTCAISSKLRCMCGLLSKKLIPAEKLYHNKTPNKISVPFKEEGLYENLFVLIGKGYISEMEDQSVVSAFRWTPRIEKMVWFNKPIKSSPVSIIDRIYNDFK